MKVGPPSIRGFIDVNRVKHLHWYLLVIHFILSSTGEHIVISKLFSPRDFN